MTTEITLVADVGGTNTRLALADANGLIADSTQRYANAQVRCFSTAVRTYLQAQQGIRPTAICVAIAGPVTKGHGQLTNLKDWQFDACTLAESLAIPRVILINDLAALGYALPDLPPRVIHQIGGATAQNDQALIVGVATGFNVSLCQNGQVYESELGHASLPNSVMETLRAKIGKAANAFTTVESLFSGGGLEQLHQQLGHAPKPATEITTDDNGTRALFTQALGVMCRELTYQYMPLGGLYFNGSLARAVLQGQGAENIATQAAQDKLFAGRFGQVPLYLITEDTAALYGCARYLRLNPS
jgi:glucokinase